MEPKNLAPSPEEGKFGVLGPTLTACPAPISLTSTISYLTGFPRPKTKLLGERSWALPKTSNFRSWALSWAQSTNFDKSILTTCYSVLLPKTNDTPSERSDYLNHSEALPVSVHKCCLIADIQVECVCLLLFVSQAIVFSRDSFRLSWNLLLLSFCMEVSCRNWLLQLLLKLLPGTLVHKLPRRVIS